MKLHHKLKLNRALSSLTDVWQGSEYILRSNTLFTTYSLRPISTSQILKIFAKFVALHCVKTARILVRIFPHSDGMRRDTLYLSAFSPNSGKYGSK